MIFSQLQFEDDCSIDGTEAGTNLINIWYLKHFIVHSVLHEQHIL